MPPALHANPEPLFKPEDKSRDHAYFIITPQLVWALCRDPYELALWNTIKMIAGDTEQCILSTPDLAALAMMSAGKCSACRRFLLQAQLLRGKCFKDPGYPQPVWHLQIPDIWQRNLIWRKQYNSLRDRIQWKREQKSLHLVKASPGEKGTSPGEKGTSPGETKNILQEDPKEERVWKECLAELHLQMTHATFDTWIAPCRLIRLRNGTDNAYRILIGCPSAYVVDWLTHRLNAPITRTLTGILQAESVAVEYTLDLPPHERTAP